ncbi:hypothetical protein [uncultured Treponema sp.]|nr:hypothetical protein [uncultured Treponema sp.]
MPGLSQLKKFNSDILSLGNEAELRSKRGEKVGSLPIPKGIKDVDDSDDFVMGMPEPSEDVIAAMEEKPALDEDLSDIMGSSSSSDSAPVQSEAPSAPVPDVSSLLNPIGLATASDENDAVPDLSLFMEPVDQEEPEEVPEEKEPEISDLSLEDLLGGTGFDGSEGTSENSDAETESDNFTSSDEPEEFSGTKNSYSEENSFSTEPAENVSAAGSIPSLSDVLGNADESGNSNTGGSMQNDADLFAEPLEDAEPLETLDDEPEELGEGEDVAPGTSFSAEDFAELSQNSAAAADADAEPASESQTETLSEPNLSNKAVDDIPLEEGKTSFSADDFDLASFDDANFDVDNLVSGDDDIELQDADETAENKPAQDVSSETDGKVNDAETGAALGNEADSFNLPDIDFDDVSDKNSENKTDDVSSDGEAEFENAGIPDGLFDSSDMELPPLGDEVDAASDFVKEAEQDDAFKLSDFDGDNSGFSLDTPDFSSAVPSDEDVSPSENESLNLDDAASSGDGASSGNAVSSGDASDGGSSDDFPADFNFNLDDAGGDESSFPAADESVPAETFDISAMEGLEFPDTDAKLAGNDASGFELGSDDDIQFENSDFEIPGFSDVDIVAEQKNGKLGPVPAPAEPEPDDNNGLPPNTLSDEQYQKFLKNLSSYPLNVRIAVEDLIVKNEFTDEAEFEIILKVLKKVPARQLASELEKMLDIALPVPRDFERRTSEEYEIYKSSFQYQLRNKIIPGAIVCSVATGLCILLFLFAKNFIYKPAKASSLYRQGYVLLEADDYPNSELKFNEAVLYDLQKKWFFRYAQGYRRHKQYTRAEQMYRNILYCFNHDKTAGLEYAEMELNDLANYEKAENVLLRDVLDYHVNDSDGLLLLGDTYLEWATEKDFSKFEDARVKYAELIQLYGPTNLYMSRMMRYFIRTDNLLEVLQLKERFMPKEKSLSAQDWTELSGFMLDKLYGPLAPADEYLRTKIEDVKEMLMRAVRADSSNPAALYNLSRYYVQMNNSMNAKSSLERTLLAFENAPSLKKRDIYKYIDSYRLLGEQYIEEREYLKAREYFTSGISLFQNEQTSSGFEGNHQVGKLYADMGDIDYFISGDVNSALLNYQDSVSNDNDTSEIRYKIGAIQYGKKNYSEAIGSFMKASEDNPDDTSLLLAMGNTLSLRNDAYASQGYYERLIDILDAEKEQKGILFPQMRSDESEIVDLYLKASNNLGVTLYKLARRTGNSTLNAQAISNFQESIRAWDALTRNQQTLIRLGGSNLAEQNIKYLTHPMPDFEPAIYTDVPRTLSTEEGLNP